MDANAPPAVAAAIASATAPGRAGQGARSDAFIVRSLGLSAYEPTWRAMQAFTAVRTTDTSDEVWLTEHPPIYTLGLAGRREHILRETGVPTLKVDRGGQVTYHGPGQIVAYLLFDLRRKRLGIRQLVRTIEAAVIELAAMYAIDAYGRSDAPGVYVRHNDAEAKIAALGLKVKNGCTYHGLALNVDMDLTPFSDIDPCGYPGLAVTQLKDFGVTAPRREIELRLVAALARRLSGAAAVRSAAPVWTT